MLAVQRPLGSHKPFASGGGSRRNVARRQQCPKMTPRCFGLSLDLCPLALSPSGAPSRARPGVRRAAQAADPDVTRWLESNLPSFGKVTGCKFVGGSGWSSAYFYETESGLRLFVKLAMGSDPKGLKMFRARL